MSTANLIRWSGLISLLAGVLYITGALLHPVGEDLATVTSSNWIPSHLVYWVAALLFHLSLTGIYLRQAEQAGWLGLVGFVLAFIGTTLITGVLLFVAVVLPVIASDAPAIFDQAVEMPVYLLPVFLFGFGLGWILMGVTTMRSGVLPRWAGLLLVIGVTLFVIMEAGEFEPALTHIVVTSGDILFGLGLIWIGYALWSEKREPALSDATPA